MATAGAYLNPVDVRPGFPRVNPITGVLVGALGVLIAAYLALVFVYEAPVFLLIAPAVCAVLAGVALLGRRWSAIPAAVLVTLNLAVEIPNVLAWHLHDMENSGAFAINVVILPIASVVVGTSAILYTIRAYRCGVFSLPSWARNASIAAAAVAVGGSLAAFAPSYGAPARVDPDAVNALEPSIVMANNEFVQEEVRVQKGEVVQWRVANADNETHTFDLDGYGIRMTVNGGESGFVMFVADEAGTFDFNCSVPGHTMSGKLVVE